MTRVRVAIAFAVAVGVACGIANATVYEVGPGKKHSRISDVVSMLEPGDLVEVSGDMADSFTLAKHGTSAKPIVIRGLTRVEGGRIVRPGITLTNSALLPGIFCRGDWNVLEGLEITGAKGSTFTSATAILVECDNLLVRNCYIHHNRQGIHSFGNAAGDITIEFCEFDSNGMSPWVTDKEQADGIVRWLHSAYLTSSVPRATVIVQHCYFHDGTGGSLLKLRFPRALVRYNWFESSYFITLNIIGLHENVPETFPMHTDIVGNVFDQGSAPCVGFCPLQLGGDSRDAPGTEGDFNIAHNLFLMRYAMEIDANDDTAALPGQTYATDIILHGNVDAMRLYNNVFLELGVPGAVIYERGTVWKDIARTRAFVEKRGHGDPVISGSHNWMSKKTKLFPPELKNTFRGTAPGFMDILANDYRPRSDSPLVGKALSPLPMGRVGELRPAFEPHRGIPADLKPRSRPSSGALSLGPFGPGPEALGDNGVEEMFLAVEGKGTQYTWRFH